MSVEPLSDKEILRIRKLLEAFEWFQECLRNE